VDKRYISYNTHDTVPVFCVNLSSIETLSFQLPTAKPRRPGPEARNRVALIPGVVTIIFVALRGVAETVFCLRPVSFFVAVRTLLKGVWQGRVGFVAP